MSERSPVALRLAVLARAAARRGELREARIRVAEAVRLDPRGVSSSTWETLVDAHEDADAVSRAILAVLCARDPSGRANRIGGRVLSRQLLRGAQRLVS